MKNRVCEKEASQQKAEKQRSREESEGPTYLEKPFLDEHELVRVLPLGMPQQGATLARALAAERHILRPALEDLATPPLRLVPQPVVGAREHIREEAEEVVLDRNHLTPRGEAFAGDRTREDGAICWDHHFRLSEAVAFPQPFDGDFLLAVAVAWAAEAEQGVALLQQVEGVVRLALRVQQLAALEHLVHTSFGHNSLSINGGREFGEDTVEVAWKGTW